ncbi:hypothetical protein INT48_008086 [Thamnidium elegans]|uniref:Arrestin C-terminal-like domain-containing protein n=1 Tax=Thamnidium elegans TaxID=101142 RepID=A0A8H7SHU0_9FUNG|nr:hypothetical protein INT48_008086 [Thamnidium elegans]
MDQVKSWCLNTLQLPLHTNNRISPCDNKRISFSPSVQSTTSTVISDYLKKKLHDNRSILSTVWLKKKGQHLKENNVIKIYMKSPHVVANGELVGTLVIDQKNVQQVELSLLGIEVVHDIHYPFLNSLIFNLDHHQIHSHLYEDKLVIPFVITLSPELGGSYADKRCSIQYELQCFLKSNDQIRSSKKTLLIYPNVSSLKSKDAIDLYVPILDSKQVWKSVMVDLSLSRMVWMSGAPIYITVKINNPTRYTICDMKLQLLRKQTILNNVSCDIVSHSSLSKMGWWQPLESNSRDNVTMTIDAPLNQVTVRNQKLIDVSFSIQMLICSAERTDIVAEFPVILVHPIAMDPPPSSAKEPDVSSLRPPLSKTIDLSASSLTSILSITQPIPVSPLPPTSQRALQKMKKSISSWGTLLSRKISFTHIGTSPRMISSYTASTSSITTYSTTQDQPEDLGSLAEQRSMMKFGHIKGPKRFGQQPGCLGDAGLDIRNCFNVATAAEVIQSYAAEKVEIGTLCNSPVSFSEANFKLKDGNIYNKT